VATQDISEPSFYALYNTTNVYLCLNGTNYPLNADGSVPSSLVTLLEKAGVLDAPAVAPLTITGPMVQFSAAGNFPSPLTPQVTASNSAGLLPGQYLRVALLMDATVQEAFSGTGTGGDPFYRNSWYGQFATPGYAYEVQYSPGTITVNADPFVYYLGSFSFDSTFLEMGGWGTGCPNGILPGTDPTNPYLSADGKAFPVPTLVQAVITF